MNIEMDVTQAGPLVVFALNSIAPEDPCCTRCCATCYSLDTLLAGRKLDAIIEGYAARDGGGWAWWDSATGRVDRTWLARAWRRTDCHESMRKHTGEHPRISQ